MLWESLFWQIYSPLLWSTGESVRLQSILHIIQAQWGRAIIYDHFFGLMNTKQAESRLSRWKNTNYSDVCEWASTFFLKMLFRLIRIFKKNITATLDALSLFMELQHLNSSVKCSIWKKNEKGLFLDNLIVSVMQCVLFNDKFLY